MDVRAVLTRVMVIVAACGAGGASSATNAPRDRTVLAIPAGRLNMALRQLATQTGQQIVFDPAMVGRRTAAALHGPIDAERALKMLLSGSGLVARHLRPGVIIIVVAPPARPSDVSTAIAQVAAPDIVVTALKRPTALGDTEVSMDAVTGAQVSMRGAYDLRSAAALLPGLVPIATAPLQQRIAIRGVTGTGEATVASITGKRRSAGPRAPRSIPPRVRPTSTWSTSSGSSCCVGRRARCTARVRWEGRCASCSISPTRRGGWGMSMPVRR